MGGMTSYPTSTRPSGTPLKTWKVRNFKSIKDAELSFAPLTLLVGANSSGKTSLMQSILLVVQAAQGENRGSTFPLNGSLVSVGGFNDARFAHSEADAAIEIGGRLQFSQELADRRPPRITPAALRSDLEKIYWRLTFDRPAEHEPGSTEIAAVEFRVEQPEEIADHPSALELRSNRTTREASGSNADDQMLARGRMVVWAHAFLASRDEFSLGFGGMVSAGETPVPIRGLLLRAGIPHDVLISWQLANAAAESWVESRLLRSSYGFSSERSRAKPGRAERQPLSLLALVELAVREIEEWADRQRLEPVPLPVFLLSRDFPLVDVRARTEFRRQAAELVDLVTQRLSLSEEVLLPPEREAAGWLREHASMAHDFFRQRVLYLGPLRQDPQVVYKTAPLGAAGFIGTKGEFLATVLHAYRARRVRSFNEDGVPVSRPLAEAVNFWVKRLDIADRIETRDRGRLGIEVSVRRGDIPPVDLTGVGVGVSQLLPVIVMCLLAEPGSLILMEQPELHLHPGLQQKLADFLLACARSGRQLVVETHSEYMVSRLRLKAAEDVSGDLLDAFALYFVEQKADASEYRRVIVNEFGSIEDWPIGFFQQAAEESRMILQAGLTKRSRQ
jgi:predicted ATPase